MDCGNCGSEDTTVVRTLCDGQQTLRRIRCLNPACGWWFSTTEIQNPGSLRPPVTANAHGYPPVAKGEGVSASGVVVLARSAGVSPGDPDQKDLDLSRKDLDLQSNDRTRAPRPPAVLALVAPLAPQRATPPATSEEFDAFWAAYPRKVAKAAAVRAWSKQAPNLPIVLAALEWQSKSAGWQKDGGQFIPHPASWLNGKRWEDASEPNRFSPDIRRGVAPPSPSSAFIEGPTPRPVGY